MACQSFTADDQKEFAKISGDCNPLHIDPVAARRTMFGEPLVHGVHGVLRALDLWISEVQIALEITSIKVVFNKPIIVGHSYDVQIKKCTAKDLEIYLRSAGSVATRIKLAWRERPLCDSEQPLSAYPECTQPTDVSWEELESVSGEVQLLLQKDAAERLFPNLIKYMCPLQIAALLQASTIVGVYCPGLHSLFSEIEFCLIETDIRPVIHYEVKEMDYRFGRVTIGVISPRFSGSIRAFFRPKPINQENACDLAKHIAKQEFSQQRALVVGGSRGLGEISAKLLAMGGADVKITYNSGEEDARRVVKDIVINDGQADFFHFNVAEPITEKTKCLLCEWKPTHLYYFATPSISASGLGKFSVELFLKYCDFYVDGFNDLIEISLDCGLKNAFYPSTVFIDERPKKMGEYVAAKIAGEYLCDFLEKNNKGLTINRPRLPRTATDQNLSIIPTQNEEALSVMLEQLRNLS